MFGLDSSLVDNIDYALAIGRIKNDVLTDSIFAPHWSVIYERVADELIERVRTSLRSGEYSVLDFHGIQQKDE